MASDEEPTSSGGSGSFFSRQIGGAPYYVWIGIAVAGLYIYTKFKAGTNAGQTDPTAAASTDGTADPSTDVANQAPVFILPGGSIGAPAAPNVTVTIPDAGAAPGNGGTSGLVHALIRPSAGG